MVAYELIAAYVALACGLFFFFGYALRYYLYVAVLLFLNVMGRGGSKNVSGQPTLTTHQSLKDGFTAEPLVSIQLPVFNEPNVVERLLACCTSLDYRNYEVILLDDSTDTTVDRLREWAETNQVAHTVGERKQGAQVQITNTLASMQIPIKVVHRAKRSGFKGGALNEALKYMNPDAEYVMIFDADFIPPPDIIKKSLPYFSLPSSSEILAKITALDRSYADGKMDVDTYVKEHEQLASKVRGNTAIIEASKVAMKGLFTVDQLFANGEISEYEYKLRREAIAHEMARIPIAATPYAEQPLTLHRAFTVSQLFAENKVDSADYQARIRAIFAPFNEKPHPTNEYDDLVLKIINIDLEYADGNIPEDQYTSKRKELKLKLDRLSEHAPELASAFELDQALASEEISLDDYRKGRANRGNSKNRNGNEKHGSGLLSFLRIRSRNGNENGNGKDAGNGNSERYEFVAVQGYQLHSLNQNENWLTAAVRAEYSGSYMIERRAQEFFGSMKMISGSVYMIRADILRHYRWSESITEDWELTCRLYLDGKRVAYTPTIEAAAEAPATLRRLLRQRQRWAEGHSYNVKKYFLRFMSSPNTTLTEKLEYLYYTPYYFQGLIFCIGTVAWAIQLWTQSSFPFWTDLFGWGLLLSNSFAIPLMNFAGLVSEGSRRRDVGGVFSAIVLTYIVAFFQGYAALKGFLEPKESGWIRTYKTGNITQTPLKIKPRSDTLQPIALKVARPKRTLTVNALPSRLRRTPAMMVFILLMAGLLATNLFLATNVQTVQALPANMVWYPTATQSLQPGAVTTGAELTFSHAPRLWTTGTTEYKIGESDAVSGWVFHLVCTFASQTPGYNVTVNVYYSFDSTRGNLLETGRESLRGLNCDGTNEDLIALAAMPWSGTPGTYHLNLEVSTSAPSAYLSMIVGGPHGSSLSDGNSVPEYVLPLVGLVPLIPIAMKRRRKK